MLRRSLPNCMSLGKMIAKYFASSRITYTGEQNRESFLATGKIDGASVAINKKKLTGTVLRCSWRTLRHGAVAVAMAGKCEGKKSHAFDVPPKRTRAGANREKGGEGEEYAVGGVVSRGLVGRLQPRFCATPYIPEFSLSLSLSFTPFCFVSLFLHASKAALKRYRKIITGKALHTRVRQTAGPTNRITLILVSFGPTD